MRHLQGGHSELAAIIVRSLEGTCPGTEFFLDEIRGAEAYGVYWNHAAAGAPAEERVADFLQHQWAQLEFTLGNSDGLTFSGKTGGVVAGLSVPQINGQAVDMSALLKLLNPPRKNTKTCPECGSEQRKSARGCTQCGIGFPRCAYCSRVLQDEDKYCGRCGIARCSYF